MYRGPHFPSDPTAMAPNSMLMASQPAILETGNPYGGLVCVSPKILYGFQPSASSVETQVIAKYVNTTLWVSSVLLVAVHAKNITVAGQLVDVIVHNTLYSPEDPSADILDPTIRATASIAFGAAPAVPYLLPIAFTTPIASQVRVSARATQAAGTSTAFSATLSIYLVGRLG
jgi:hypothetical protein